MKHRTTATIRQPRDTAELRSNLPAGEPTEGARSSSDDLSHEVDPNELNPREQFILRARFGLEDGYMRTLEEIGRELQLTRERVRQIEAEALGKVRHSAYILQLASFLDH